MKGRISRRTLNSSICDVGNEHSVTLDGWSGADGELAYYIREESSKTLESYRVQPTLITEHANLEQDTAHGGYQHRQLYELVQNSADALWRDPSDKATRDIGAENSRGRVEVRLTSQCLYCADDGDAIDSNGVKALLFSHLSPKRATSQIGTFGLGFKALLGISDCPEFFSRSGSFGFDRADSRRMLKEVAPTAERFPVLRLPKPVNPMESQQQDGVLCQMMKWAVNIVRVPLKPGVGSDLRKQMRDFPAEVLLFVPHVKNLELVDDGEGVHRSVNLRHVEGEYQLVDGSDTSRWMLFEKTLALTSDACDDQRPGDDRAEVPIRWAAPLERLDRPGKFWAFFPTNTPSLVPGGLNAPWKTNEDRQNLLTGRYNDELIEAAAELIAVSIPHLYDEEDPARHLDVLPRRQEMGDSEQASLLRDRLTEAACTQPIIPDQDGRLRHLHDVSYPPSELTPGRSIESEALDRWVAYENRPRDWLHHKALATTRLATINRLHRASSREGSQMTGTPRASIAEWLESLVRNAPPDDAVAASAAAIETAALLPANIHSGDEYGDIVLTEAGDWKRPEPGYLYLPIADVKTDSVTDPESTVHRALADDPTTRKALKKLGLEPRSPESRFRNVARRLLGRSTIAIPDDELEELHKAFWHLARELSHRDAMKIILESKRWPQRLLIRTRSGKWKPIHAVLIPGEVIPEDDSRDGLVAVDMEFHGRDTKILHELNVCGSPRSGLEMKWESDYSRHKQTCEAQYRTHLNRNPQAGYLKFTRTRGVGPLSVLTALSEESKALYTNALLSQDQSYARWEMWHTGTNRDTYPKKSFDSLTVHVIREDGRIKVAEGIVPFKHALGPDPESLSALHVLLQHPNVKQIMQAFNLTEPTPEFFGEAEPVPLTDIWPGLGEYLPAKHKSCGVIQCEAIRIIDQDRDSAFIAPDVYLTCDVEDDERQALELVVETLELDVEPVDIGNILQHTTPAEIEERRAAIRRCSTDAERLLAAVGEEYLRRGLPDALVAALDNRSETLDAINLAEAAIATYHTDVLKRFSSVLSALDPPARWAGSRKAVDFVRSLGFSEEWAESVAGDATLLWTLRDLGRCLIYTNTRASSQITCAECSSPSSAMGMADAGCSACPPARARLESRYRRLWRLFATTDCTAVFYGSRIVTNCVNRR